MLQKGKHCSGCVLEKIGQGFALTDGTGSNGVLLVAEALGKDEALAGKPLVGKAGGTFNRLIERAVKPSLGKREDYLIANIVNCRPPNNELTDAPWEDAAIRHCSPYLEELLEKFKPKCIVAMGNQPMHWFLDLWGIDKPPHRGYIYSTKYGPVIPTYHPAYIQYGNWECTKVWQLDVAKALMVAKNGAEFFKRQKFYITHPTMVDFNQFASDYFKAVEVDPSTLLSFDIETPRDDEGEKDEKWETKIEETASYTTILRISFSYAPYHAISVPWIEPFISTIRRLLGAPFGKVVWNRHFDVPRVTHKGCPVGGMVYDGMDAFHFLEPSLKMGLKYVATFFCPDMEAWFLDSNRLPEYYNAADSDVALRCLLAIRRRLEEQGRWKTFEEHFVRLGLVLDAITRRGVGVDRELRHSERIKLEARLERQVSEMQPLIPQAVKPLKVYKKSKEQLENGGLWNPEAEWVEVSVPLTQKEKDSLQQKHMREQEKLRKLAEKASLREEKARVRLLKRQLKLEKAAASALKRRRKSSSKSSTPQSS